MVPNSRRRLVVAVRHVPNIAVNRGLEAAAAIIVRKHPKARSRTVVVRRGLKQHRPPAGRVGAIHPRRERNRVGAAEIDCWDAYILIGSIRRDRIPDLAAYPTDAIDQGGRITAARRIGRCRTGTLIKRPITGYA